MCNNVYDVITDLEVCGFTKNTKNLNICDIVCIRVSTPAQKHHPLFLVRHPPSSQQTVQAHRFRHSPSLYIGFS